MGKILLQNGHVVDPAQDIDGICDILIDGSVIDTIAPESVPDDVDIIDMSGKMIFPGFIDMHVHGREPGQEYKEDIESVSQAAVAGGFTSIVLMANTVPPIDSADRISFIYNRAAGAACWVYPVGAVSKRLEGMELAELADMAQAGAIAFSDDGKAIADGELMRNALAYTDQLNMPILVHEIDPVLARDGQIHEGEIASLTGMKGIPSQAETSIIARDIELMRLSGGKIHIQHITTSESINLVRDAREKGLAITCEATPHHLLLTEQAVMESGFDSNYKMMPPLRTQQDADALIAALADGTIDAIASDHAPHAVYEKDCPFDQAPFGIVGLETAVPLIWTKLVKPGMISIRRFVELMSYNPAGILNLAAGTLKPDMYADIAVFDPDIKWTIESRKFLSKSRNTPFDGWEVDGRIVTTIMSGEIVHNL